MAAALTVCWQTFLWPQWFLQMRGRPHHQLSSFRNACKDKKVARPCHGGLDGRHHCSAIRPNFSNILVFFTWVLHSAIISISWLNTIFWPLEWTFTRLDRSKNSVTSTVNLTSQCTTFQNFFKKVLTYRYLFVCNQQKFREVCTFFLSFQFIVLLLLVTVL